jgi:hypothetical protein
MNDPESAYSLISTELARRRALSLQRASLTWNAEPADGHLPPPLRGRVGVGGMEDCRAAGDYGNAA